MLLAGLLSAVLAAAPALAQDALLAPLSDGVTLPLPDLDPAVPTPASVLGYPLGQRFTQHHRVLDYLHALDAASDRVTLWTYGETYEGRPLTLVAISSPQNLARLEEIRNQQLRLAWPAGLGTRELQELQARAPAIVWLGYGVHGNESSSTEAAMATAYVLAAGQGPNAVPLDDVVVLIEPLLNPDGRERYVHGYLQRRGAQADAAPEGMEHFEDWPGGRFNHYLTDLNRDWAWGTQQETRARLAAYQRWEPQVAVDLHEMGYDSTYFFPPAAQPILGDIDSRTLHWLEVFGRGNAAAFERQGWLYFKEEQFDLFYPGYGDSYPSLRRAVGMTYEVAGGGRAGQAVRQWNDRSLTLADRLARHTATSLATVATAARNRRQLVADFVAARLAAGEGSVTTYLWSAEQQQASSLAELLALHGVTLERLARPQEVEARAVIEGASGPQRFAAGTWVASTSQPLGSLLRVLLEREMPMPASFLERQRQRLEQNRSTEFYDITAWSLAMAYGVEVWAVDGELSDLEPAAAIPAAGKVEGEGAFGFLVPPEGLSSYRLAAALERAGFTLRLALEGFELRGRSWPAGTLFVPRSGNAADLPARLGELAAESGATAWGIDTGYTESGLSLGSDDLVPLRAPRIGLVGGEGISPTGHGALWFLLDQLVSVPFSRLELSHLGDVDLGSFDVLVLPEGDYGSLGDPVVAELKRWLQRGGTLVAVGRAQGWLADHELSTFKPWSGEKSSESSSSGRHMGLESQPIDTPGAALATVLSMEHPLALGLDAAPAVLTQGERILLPSGDPRRDVLRAREEEPVIAGFVWPEAVPRLAGSLLVGTEPMGAGRVVVFAQDPAFRNFWRATMPLFLNAVCYGPSLNHARSVR